MLGVPTIRIPSGGLKQRRPDPAPITLPVPTIRIPSGGLKLARIQPMPRVLIGTNYQNPERGIETTPPRGTGRTRLGTNYQNPERGIETFLRLSPPPPPAPVPTIRIPSGGLKPARRRCGTVEDRVPTIRIPSGGLKRVRTVGDLRSRTSTNYQNPERGIETRDSRCIPSSPRRYQLSESRAGD